MSRPLRIEYAGAWYHIMNRGGRYTSIFEDNKDYSIFFNLLQVMRYIHRNPVKAGLTNKLDYQWSSHKAYLSSVPKWDWVSREKILNMLTGNKTLQKTVYKDFVNTPDENDFSAIYKKRKPPSILGSKKFIEQLKEQFFTKKKHVEVPDSQILIPEKSKILTEICISYKVSPSDLKISRRGHNNEARNVAIYLMRKLRCDTLMDICKEFGLKKDSSAGSIVDRVKKQLKTDKKLKMKISKIEQKIAMS